MTPRVRHEAEEMAKAGYGWENIMVALRDKGLTRFEARTIVFGRGKALWMEWRDAKQAEKAS